MSKSSETRARRRAEEAAARHRVIAYITEVLAVSQRSGLVIAYEDSPFHDANGSMVIRPWTEAQTDDLRNLTVVGVTHDNFALEAKDVPLPPARVASAADSTPTSTPLPPADELGITAVAAAALAVTKQPVVVPPGTLNLVGTTIRAAADKGHRSVDLTTLAFDVVIADEALHNSADGIFALIAAELRLRGFYVHCDTRPENAGHYRLTAQW